MREEPDDDDKGAEQQRNEDEAEPQRFTLETETTSKEIIGGLIVSFHINKYGRGYSRIAYDQNFFSATSLMGVLTLAQDHTT